MAKKKQRQSLAAKKLAPTSVTDHNLLVLNLSGKSDFLNSEREANLSQIGVKIIEYRDIEADNENNLKCDWFVFQKTLGERWHVDLNKRILQDPMAGYALFAKTKSFLEKRGYKQVASPMKGDVVAYISRKKETIDFYITKKTLKKITVHFGIYESKGRVISKFGEDDIYSHPIHMVTCEYGEEMIFFRKR